MLGFNEAINSGFENNDPTTLGYYGPYFNATVTRDTGVARPGSVAGTAASLRIDATPDTQVAGVLCTNAYRLHAPGEVCVVSTYIKGTAGNQVKIRDRIVDRFFAYVSEGSADKIWTLTGGWDRIWTLPFTNNNDYFIPGFAIITTNLLAQTFWIDDVQIEENAVSTYFPARQERAAGLLIGALGLTQAAYEWNGMAFTGAGTSGDFIVDKVSGLFGHPELRTTDQERSAGHGDFGGVQMAKARHVAMDLTVRADTSAIIETYIRNLKRVFEITDGTPGPPLPLVFSRYPSREQRFVMAKLEKYEGDSTYDVSRRLYTASIMWKCDDPRIYSTLFPTFSGSMVSVANILFNAMNAGNADAFWTATVTGPALNPKVQNDNDRARFIKATANIASGHFITFDSRSRTALIDGVTPAPLTTDSLWWAVKPGFNQIRVFRDSATGTAPYSFSYRDTWL